MGQYGRAIHVVRKSNRPRPSENHRPSSRNEWDASMDNETGHGLGASPSICFFPRPRAKGLSMKNGISKIALTLLATAGLCSCSNRQETFEGMIPAGATSVSFSHQSDVGAGVTFHARSDANSYKYVDVIRQKLHESGYTLCKKSAISQWEKQPVGAGHPATQGLWIVELYTSDHYGSFFVLRSVALPTAGGRDWSQDFSLAVQSIPPGRQDMASIKDFCD